MDIELWLAFIAAYTIVSIIPGPSVFMVTAFAMTRGTRAAFWCILGDVIGGFFVIALSLVGVGAILAASAELFQIVKWAGIFYMALLGYRQIVEARRAEAPDVSADGASASNSMKAGFLVGVLNPKAILFYMAFLSQFLSPDGDPLLQFAILAATSTIIVGAVLGGYALMAARARASFRSEKARRRFGYAGGGFLIGGSVLMATTR